MATQDEEQENRHNAGRPHLSVTGDDEDGRDATGKVAGDGARRRTANMSGTPRAEATNRNALADGKASMADTVAVKGQPVKLKTVDGTSELSLRDAFYWAPKLFTQYKYETRDELSLALGNYYATTMYQLLQNGQVYVEADDGTERALSALDMQPLIASREPHCLNLDGVSFDGEPGGFHLYTEDEERAVRAVTWNGNHFSAEGKKEFDAQASNEEDANASTRAEDVDATGKNKQRAKGAKANAQNKDEGQLVNTAATRSKPTNGKAKGEKKAPHRKLPAKKERVAASTKAASVAAAAGALGGSISDDDSREEIFDLAHLDDDDDDGERQHKASKEEELARDTLEEQPAPPSTHVVAMLALVKLFSEAEQKLHTMQAEKDGRIRDLEREKRSLEDDLVSCKQALKEANEKLQADNQEVQDMNRTQQETIHQLTNDKQNLESESLTLKQVQELLGVVQENEKLQKTIQQLTVDKQALTATTQELQSENRKQRDKIATLREKYKRLKQGRAKRDEELVRSFRKHVFHEGEGEDSEESDGDSKDASEDDAIL